jgi:hypothetical protein
MTALDRYDFALANIRELFRKKNAQYGDSAFYTGEDHSPFKWWMRFSDVSRKFTRLEQLTRIVTTPTHSQHEKMLVDEAREKLIDDYKDLANYAIIAVAVLEEAE